MGKIEIRSRMDFLEVYEEVLKACNRFEFARPPAVLAARMGKI